MSAMEDEETFDCTVRANGSIGGGGDGSFIAGNSSIIDLATMGSLVESISRRFETYRRRRSAATPNSTPGDNSIIAPPTPRSILGDSETLLAGNGGSSVLKTHVQALSSSQAPLMPPSDNEQRPISISNRRPPPYWEEREMYLAAEELCCYVNGGVNYRVLCRQYQRALELLLALVREDLNMCTSGELEVAPRGTQQCFLNTLKTLLKESQGLLESAGVEIPQGLTSLIENLCETGGVTRTGGSAHQSLSTSGAHASSPSPAPSPLFQMGRSFTSSVILSGRNEDTDAKRTTTMMVAASERESKHHAAPSETAPVVAKRPPSANLNNSHERGAGTAPNEDATAGLVRRQAALPSTRHNWKSPNSGSVLLNHAGTHNDCASRAAPQPLQTHVNGSLGGLPLSSSTRRHAPLLTAIVDGGQDRDSHDIVDKRGSHEEGRSILRKNDSTSSVPGAAAVASTSGGGLEMGRSPPHRWSLRGRSPFMRHTPSTLGTPLRRGNVVNMSPVLSTPPPRPPSGSLASEGSGLRGNHTANQSSNPAGQQNEKVAVEWEEDVDRSDAHPPQHHRRRRMEELYGGWYALEGMSLLNDALAVVFTREYDRGSAEGCKSGFDAFQRAFNRKIMPGLQSFANFQLRITDMVPLHSAYLSSCLAKCVRPNDAVLDHLKGIDQDRTPEVLLLGGLRLGSRGVVALVESVVPRLYRLHRLDLSDNDVDDAAVVQLARTLRYHPSLQSLNLSRNPLTDHSVHLLLRLRHTLPQLSDVLLQSTAMTASAREIIETEVAYPGTYMKPPAPHLRDQKSVSGAREGAAQSPKNRSAAASMPRFTLPPPVPKGGEKKVGPPDLTSTRAESLPVMSTLHHSIAPSSQATFPRGLGVKLEPLQPASLRVKQPPLQSDSTNLLPE